MHAADPDGNMTVVEIATPQGASYMRARCPAGSWAKLMRQTSEAHRPRSSTDKNNLDDDVDDARLAAAAITESQLLQGDSEVPFGIAWVMHEIYEKVDPQMKGFASRFELIMRAAECEAGFMYEELGALVEQLRCITTSNPPPEVLSHDQFFELCCAWYVTGERWRMRFSRV